MQFFDTDMVERVSLTLRRLVRREPARAAALSAQESQPRGDVARRARVVYSELRRVGSNLELDWLWLAAQLADPADRRDALERALAINPQSELAARQLASLAPFVAEPCQNCPA